VQRKEIAPPVVVEQVKANHHIIYGDGFENPPAQDSTSKEATATPRIAPGGARVLEIRYTANSLAAPDKMRFTYKLEGYDHDWVEAGERRVAFYTNLRPGDYRFRLKAQTHHGTWCEAPAEFAFVLTPHFYETWAFYAGCTSVVIALAAAVQTFRLRVQRKLLQLDHEQSLERERARIARDLHDDLGASLTGVALQLEAAERIGGAEGKKLAALAAETRSLAHEVRELAWTTNPRCDNAGSLAAFIGEFTERVCHAAGLNCKLNLPVSVDHAVPAGARHQLLMVLKESLANVTKHAQAQSVSVELAMNNGDVQLTIKDDGRGFVLSKHRRGGSGLANLRDRVEQSHGMLRLESQPGKGTTIIALMPVKETV